MSTLTNDEIDAIANLFIAVLGYQEENTSDSLRGLIRLFARKTIAANNLKVLTNLQPAVTEEELIDMLIPNSETITICYYSDDQVSALLQEISVLQSEIMNMSRRPNGYPEFFRN